MLFGPSRKHPAVEDQQQFITLAPEAALGLAELDPRYTEFEESSETPTADPSADPASEPQHTEDLGPEQPPRV